MTKNKNQRFSLCAEDYIVDELNSINNGKGHYFPGDPDDEMYLRECVLRRRVSDLMHHLITNNNPMRTLPNGEWYQPSCDEDHSLWWPIFTTIKASHLNTLPVALSIQHRFGGDLNRKNIGWQQSTSLSRFVDDVEHLLRDLYGEGNIGALDRVREAVFVIVEELTRYLRKDLWQEHQNAVMVDYMCGIGVPEGCGISGSDHRRGLCAAEDLELRARTVRANPEAFSKYTVQFVNELFSRWPSLNQPVKDLWRSEQVQLPKDFPF